MGITLINRIKTLSFLFLCITLLLLNIPVSADGEFEDAAEIISNINVSDYKIPSIRVSEWTSINITVTDAFGIDWEQLSSVFPIRSRYLWPILHPSWKPFLGYTSLSFVPEIVEGDPNGWRMKVSPNGIFQANSGNTYDLKLEIQADDINVDYAVVVGIRAIRSDTYGNPIGDSYIYVPVKASALNNVKMQTTVTTKEAPLHSIMSFDATISNYGYYKDMFSIELRGENDLEILSPNQVIVLDPGASQKISIDVLTPEKLFDPGTPHRIEVYVTSSGDPDAMHIGSLVVITKGMYISPLAFITAAPIVLIILLAFLFFMYTKEKRERELFGKPNKPWLIPEEKRYLDELREKDKEKYNEVMNMMRDEYTSALLWYQSSKKNDYVKQEAKGGLIGRLKHPLIKSESKDEEPVEEENKKTKSTKKPSKEPVKDTSEKMEPEQPVKKNNASLSSLKGLVKKVHLPEKKQKEEPDEMVDEQKEKEPEEPVIDHEQLKLLKEKEEKKRKKEEAMKKIKKAQTKQKRNPKK